MKLLLRKYTEKNSSSYGDMNFLMLLKSDITNPKQANEHQSIEVSMN